MTRSMLLPALALSVALVTAGCGSDEEPEAKELTHEQFVEQANKICADGQKEIEKAAEVFGDEMPSEEEYLAFIEDTLVPSTEGQLEAISDLNAPDEDEEAAEKMLSSLQDGIDQFKEDPDTEGGDAFDDANAAATELGLTDCAAE